MVKMKKRSLGPLKGRTYRQAGFTLIELLVVIAIIGLLAAVVLASVGSARNKGVDATVKSQLNAARSAAELFAANNNNSYANVCGADAGALNTTNGILAGAAAPTGAAIVVNAPQTLNTQVACEAVATGGSWVVSAPLSASTRGFWCVDSSGNSRAVAAGTFINAASVACP